METLCHVTGRRRASTLRQRLKTFEQISKWYLRRYGLRYSSDVGLFIEYLEMLADEPCGRTVPRTRLCALAMMEMFADFDPDERVSSDRLVIETVNSLEVKLGVNANEPIKATLVPLVLIMALELYTASNRKKFLRFVACNELLKVYGVMRGDDLKGLMTSSIRFGKHNVRLLKLRRTKSTGSGRKIEWLVVAVDYSCDLTSSGWLEAAEVLLKDPSLMWDRDYLMAMPHEDLEAALHVPACYEDARAFTTAVLDDLKVPVWNTNAEKWEESEETLLIPGLSDLWGAHSARGVLPSMAADQGAGKEARDYLGHWQGDGSDAYSRNARAAIANIQRDVMARLKSRPHEIDEDEIFEQIWVHLPKRGYTPEAIRDQIERLRFDHYMWPGVTVAGTEDDSHSAVEPTEVHVDGDEATVAEEIEGTRKAKVARLNGEADVIVRGFYILAHTRKNITLHRDGGCYRTQCPEHYFSKHDSVSEYCSGDYTQKCKLCFGELRINASKEALKSEPVTNQVIESLVNEDVATESEDSSSSSDYEHSGNIEMQAEQGQTSGAEPSEERLRVSLFVASEFIDNISGTMA